MEGLVLRCGVDPQLQSLTQRSNLVCRFQDGCTAAAQYCEEDQTIRCTPTSKVNTTQLAYDVVDALTDTILLSRKGADEPSTSEHVEAKPKKTLRERYDSLAPFIIISTSYLLFTITDGAVRMIVLLYAYQKGFTAMQVAIMFSFYELASVFTNFLAGIAGARWGIKSTLLVGLLLQLAGIGMLYGWSDTWTTVEAIIYVTAAQALCGVAKDLTKLGGKTVTKLVTADDKQSSLFKLVSFITGLKNSFKGLGYFLGSVLIIVSLQLALGVLMGLIALAMPWALFGLSSKLGRTRKENIKPSAVFKKDYNVNMLSLSRVFLFGSRDLWFEVPLPFFMRNSTYGLGWGRALVGATLATFIIMYGQVQSWTPQLVTKPLRQSPPNKFVATLWCFLLSPVPTFLALMLPFSGIFAADLPSGPRAAVLLPSLVVFAVIFAINSSIHSYLIVRYADGDKVAMTVGWYYMSNAVGRLVGTIVSGALYSYVGANVAVGFAVCFAVSLVFTLLSALIDVFIRDNVGGLACGYCLGPCFVPAIPAADMTTENASGSDTAVSAAADGAVHSAAVDNGDATHAPVIVGAIDRRTL